MNRISDWDKSQAQLIAELEELRQEVDRLRGETLAPEASPASISLSADENRVRNILHLAPLPLMIHTQNGEIIQINKAWTDLTGYHHRDIPTITHWTRQAHPHCCEEVQTAIAHLYDVHERICTAEYTITTKTGQHRTWEFTCASLGTLADGRRVAISMATDITEPKRTEAALSQLAAIVEDSEDAIWSKTLDGTVVSWNASAQQLFGYSPAEAIGQSIFTLIVPSDRHSEETTLLKKIAGGESVQQFETVRMRKNDTPIHVALTISPVKDGRGKITGISTIARDISDRRQIERIKNEFISIVSHEIRTPLTSIRGAIGLLASGMYQNKPERVQRMLEIALTDSDRLVRLVNDILDLERLESGRLELVKERCDAAKAISQAVEGLQAIAQKEGVRFCLPPGTATVWASPHALQQILTNLLSNAIKFSPPQSIITLTVQPQWQGVLFAVGDSGRGIPPDKVEMIFNPFQQVDASDSRQKGGTGLGLTICKRIVHQHGGRIWVESTLGEGSTFYFTLPDPPSGWEDGG